MIKETEFERKIEKNESDWHFKFANKVVENWPSWKKEIYSIDNSTKQSKELVLK